MNLSRKIVLILIAVLAVVAFTQIDFSSADDEKDTPQKEKLKPASYQVTHTEGLSSWSVAVKSAELTDSLDHKTNVTVFAPSDSAFARIKSERYAELMSSAHREELRQLVKHHIIRGAYSRDDLLDRKDFVTMAGDTLHFSESADTLKVNGIPVKGKSTAASNGVIYVIDQILKPSAGK